jgi:hypothetical protein
MMMLLALLEIVAPSAALAENAAELPAARVTEIVPVRLSETLMPPGGKLCSEDSPAKTVMVAGETMSIRNVTPQSLIQSKQNRQSNFTT